MARTTMTGLWVLLAVLWFANLPLRPLFDPDEGRYAEIPREMLASGDWVTPTLNGWKYFEKPPLQYWATASLYSVFGVHEWTAKLWATTLAFLCIPMVYFYMRRSGYPTQTALIAAALLMINPYYAICGQLNLLDQGFTFFLGAALFAFALAQRGDTLPRASRRWMLVTWAALALAVLSKGIVALVLAGATLAVYMIVTRDFTLLRRLNLLPGIPLFLLITIPWFWAVQSRNPEFFQFFFIREHFQRFLTTVEDRVEPFWYFVPILLVAMLPVLANFRGWTLRAIEGERRPGEFRPMLLLLIWCAVVFALFSASQSKLSTYVMPIMPPLAVLLAQVTGAGARSYPRAKWISLGFLVLVAAALVIAGWRRYGTVSTTTLTAAVCVAVIGIGYAGFDALRVRASPASRWAALATLSIAGYQLLSLCYASAFASRSAQALAQEFGGRLQADARLYSVGQFRHSLAFYLGRPFAVYDYEGELAFGMRQAGITMNAFGQKQFLDQWQKETNAFAVMDPKEFAALSASGMSGHVVARDSRSIVVART